MGFGERLTALRKENGYKTRKEFCEIIGIPETTLRNYEKDEREPGHLFIKQMSDFFGVSADYLLGLTDVKDVTNDHKLTQQETAMVSKYRSLDDRGRATVDYILDEEYYRSQKIQEALYYADDDEYAWYIYAGKIAAAGTWIYPGDIPIERIRERRLDEADYIVGVSGDSMQPLYEDGDLLYIKKTTEIEFAEIGLFVVNGMYYVKEYAPDGLRSANPKYATIPKSSDIIVVGKVIGKVEK